MSNPVHLHVVIHGFPAEFVEPGAVFRGQDFPPQLDLVAMTRERPGWMDSPIRAVGSALVWLGGNDAFDVEYDAATETLTLAGEVNHGLARLQQQVGGGADDGLLPALRAAGLAHFAAEHDGRFAAWRPGWPEPRFGSTLQGDVVLDEQGFHELMREHATVGDGALAVARYFAVAEEVAKTREEVPADA